MIHVFNNVSDDSFYFSLVLYAYYNFLPFFASFQHDLATQHNPSTDVAPVEKKKRNKEQGQQRE